MSVWASPDSAIIKLREVKCEGLMNVNSSLSITATFDVQRNDMFDELRFDYYVLLEPRDKDRGSQFMHCRTVHRYLEKESGYKTGVTLAQRILKCINPRHVKYAVVVTYHGKEVGVESSEKKRWWEDKSLGKPIENILVRSTSLPIVREWESAK